MASFAILRTDSMTWNRLRFSLPHFLDVRRDHLTRKCSTIMQASRPSQQAGWTQSAYAGREDPFGLSRIACQIGDAGRLRVGVGDAGLPQGEDRRDDEFHEKT